MDRLIRKINEQPTIATARRNKFNLYFLRDTVEEIKELKKDATRKLNFIKNDNELEVDINDIYKPNSALDIPIRPKWDFNMSKEELEARERAYFQKYLEKVFENFNENSLSYFELNLETWRQLWLKIISLLLIIKK